MDLEVKLLEKNRRKSLESRDKQRVLMFDTKSMIHKRKIKKLDFINFLSVCFVEDHAKKLGKQV